MDWRETDITFYPDKPARRAVDACGGTYTPEQVANGYADGHRDALQDAMRAVGCADDLTAELLEALKLARNHMVSEGSAIAEICDAAIARATGTAT